MGYPNIYYRIGFIDKDNKGCFYIKSILTINKY